MPEPEIAPVAEPVVVAPLDDNLDVGELLELAATQAAPRTISMVAPTAEDAPDDEEDGEDGDEAAGESAGGDEEGTAPPSDDEIPATGPADTAARPVRPEIVQSAGQAIATDPTKLAGILHGLRRAERVAAVEEAMKLAYARGTTDTFTAMQSTSGQEEELRAFVTEQDALRADDPEAFDLWEDENLEDAARYTAGRAYFAARKAGKPAAMPGAPRGAEPVARALPPEQQVIQELADEEQPRLSALTVEQRAVIRGGDFPLTTAGLRALRKAISDAEAVQTSAKPRDPATVRRQENATRREGLARPQMGRGQAAPPKQNPLADINDVGQLFEMALEGAKESRAG